ncbi:hypothetical protein [Pseudomonas sp. PLMAX]|uniref:hypothetical protein n=1 Tax=Pseudomonas sp. PLMAX TaxID=2201998 RepID=UPI0038BA9C88
MPELASDFYASRSGTGTDPQLRFHSKLNRGLDSLLDPSLVEQARTGRRGDAAQAALAAGNDALVRDFPRSFRRMSAWDVVGRMNIMLPGQRPLFSSAVVQARQN